MPPKGYKHITLRKEIYDKLDKIRNERGLSSINDVIVLLLDHYDIYSKLEYILRSGVRLPQSGVYTPNRGKDYKYRKSKAKNSEKTEETHSTKKSGYNPDFYDYLLGVLKHQKESSNY